MSDLMIEIDIEDLLIGAMDFEKPVLRGTINDAQFIDITDDILDFGPFTSFGIVAPLVYGVGALKEFYVEDLFEFPGLDFELPVIRDTFNSGFMAELKLGGPLPLDEDTLRLIDFENNKTHTIALEKGLIKSWSTVEVGDPPAVPNTHFVVIKNGLVLSWDITPGGVRDKSIGHSVECIKGLVQAWTGPQIGGYLLLEDSFNILKEDGYKLFGE
jgi:hypothetical protein